MSKGQTALEFLMTYGWGILLIIIMGGVLYYYGVSEPANILEMKETHSDLIVNLTDNTSLICEFKYEKCRWVQICEDPFYECYKIGGIE